MREPRLGGGGDALAAGALFGADTRDELWAEGRAVRRVVDVEHRVARERVALVHHRGVEPVEEQPRAADMPGHQRDAVRGRQVAGGDVDRVTGGRVADREVLGLSLVEGHQRRAAGVADEEHRVESLPHEGHARTEVLQHALHDQYAVVASEARVERKKPDAALGERLHQVVPHEVARRVHDDGAHASLGRPGQRAVDARTVHLQARLALHRGAGRDVEHHQFQVVHAPDFSRFICSMRALRPAMTFWASSYFCFMSAIGAVRQASSSRMPLGSKK